MDDPRLDQTSDTMDARSGDPARQAPSTDFSHGVPQRSRERAVLMIGGTDPTGRAGLSRDLAVLQEERIPGCPVVSAITVQTSESLSHVDATPTMTLMAQAEAALLEHDVRWVKVGTLVDAEQVDVVADLVTHYDLHLVLDPVRSPSAPGVRPFLDDVARERLMERLVPLATLVTPNEDEALWLTEAADVDDAAQRLLRRGAHAVLVTGGGHRPDRLHTQDQVRTLDTTHRPGHHRGTGCRLATRITAGLHLGLDLEHAARRAHRALAQELALDADLQRMGDRQREHFIELESAFPRILDELRHEHVPEVGINVAYALPNAKDPREDVLGLAGRITIAGFDKAVAGRLAFGGPHHTGRIAIVLQEYDPDARIVMNHRFDETYIDNAARHGLVDVDFRREDEPADAPSSMEWGVREAIRKNDGRVPDLIWDRGGIGKEAMIRVIARDPDDLVRKLRDMHD